MKIYYYPNHSRHNPSSIIDKGTFNFYYEKPERLNFLFNQLQKMLKPTEIIQIKEDQPYHPAFLRDLSAIHHQSLIDFFLSILKLPHNDYLYPDFFLKELTPAQYSKLGLKGKLAFHATDPSAPISSSTINVAFQTAFMVHKALSDYFQNPSAEPYYLLCRPPGHHAGNKTFGGYCYLNNSALAAHLASQHGRTAILDIDFHHGNGTQEIFYQRNDVVFVSLHADPQDEYPFVSGYTDEIGNGPGTGYNLNFPLPAQTNNQVYLEALNKALEFIHSKQVDFLILSLSFDFLKDDPLGGFQVTEDILPDIQNLLKTFPHQIWVQEGGYNLNKLPFYIEKFIQPLKNINLP